MLLSELTFGSYLTYAPHGTGQRLLESRGVRDLVKYDKVCGTPPAPASARLAVAIAGRLATLPFASFFGADVYLVPVPRSALMTEHALWVPQRIAAALVSAGLGHEVLPCLERVQPIRKASFSRTDRPTPQEHYHSIGIRQPLRRPRRMLLIDDVVTRGATLLACASRLLEACPDAEIQAFAALRMRSEQEFKSVVDPCVGKIFLRPDRGDTLRRP